MWLVCLWVACVFHPIEAAETDPNFFNVRSFGAVGDGKNLESPAIDRAIDAAARAGGGTGSADQPETTPAHAVSSAT